MAKKMRLQLWNPRTIARLIAEGRGQGYGVLYRPWLTVRDLSSLGVSSRILGHTTGRVHHLLSKHLELAFFYILDWTPLITDIREQFPLLPLEETLHIARRLGVTHPADPRTRQPIVMTTDFVATAATRGGARELARPLKPVSKLTPRAIEKLKVEHAWWAARGVDCGLVTERELPGVIVSNLAILHPFRSFARQTTLEPALIDAIAAELTAAMVGGVESLVHASHVADHAFCQEAGTALAIGNYLVATAQWNIDLTVAYHPRALSMVRHVALRPAADFQRATSRQREAA